ncbi:hypothetical protein [Duganella sp.]|uniref:hypothetical protein n=1 Tax=Duganella sp. TaxID=1904440 RepID=UPI0031DE42A7
MPDSKPAHIPTDGIAELCHLWAGKGNLHDWLEPSERSISREWSPGKVQARFAESVLWDAERTIAPLLPRGTAAWMDQFEAQLIRNTAYTDLPTAHTDWALTLSQFGRYPSPQYVDRRPVNTLESALSRVSLWLGKAVGEAELLVKRKFDRVPLSAAARDKLLAPMKVARMLELAAPDRLDEEDLAVCASAGGSWTLVARLARRLSGIWQRDPASQLALLPSTLPELGSQLFELATLGACVVTLRKHYASDAWTSLAPIGASDRQAPCISYEDAGFRWQAYYQVVPAGRRNSDGPYASLGAALGVAPLRPDVWLTFELGERKLELVIECKYSLDPSYIASGITQVLGYSKEHPVPEGWTRWYMVVGPKEAIPTMATWQDQFFIGNPDHLKALIDTILTS